MRNLYCIVGPSGSGKTTIVEALERDYGWKTIESYTTRPPRYEGETGHLFVSKEEFKQLGEMCAYTMFDGHEYGVTADLIEKNDLYVVDPAGVKFLRERYQGAKGIQVIGLMVSTEVLRQRMQLRGDSEEKIARRLMNDAAAFRGLEQIADIYVDVSGSVASVCEFIHNFVCQKEREAEHLLQPSIEGLVENASERSERFNRLAKMAKEEFGLTVVRSEEKSSFADTFGFSLDVLDS